MKLSVSSLTGLGGRVDRWSSGKELKWRQCMKRELGTIKGKLGKKRPERGVANRWMDWA